MKLKGSKILVTGGTGFLGSHIVQRCLEEDARVIVFSTGKALRNVEHLQANPRLDLIAGDMTDAASLKKAAKGADLVMHFASFTKTGETFSDPLKDFQVNVRGTLLLLDAMRENNVNKIVFASTGKVYGTPQYSPVDEKHPIDPPDPYSLGKYVCEKYIALYHKIFRFDYLILRLFGIYGPRQIPKPGSLVGVISIFVKNICNGEDVVIYGDGKLKRDFLYVDDFVRTCLNLLDKDLWQNTFNIASGRVVNLNELIKILAKKLESHKFKVSFKGPLKSDVDLCPDVSSLKAKIHYEPRISLEEGIGRYIQWYKQKTNYGPKAV
ncbi:MAG: SDR family NAD(P)-dependent oxidoreductase [Candidatus Omnitrophica bacterium]|nr:SDR family NAD(P)-dependent oxidoreductase [Candidatus Omnitrophota bacterium]MDD5591971.1 SDR family NAD(P)-dependent oxidoreductase [Candidatus Omnitrophota bacterium]